MDQNSNKALLLTVTLSCLLLSATALPTNHLLTIAPAAAPTADAVHTISGHHLFSSLLSKVVKHISPEINHFCAAAENPTLCAETIAPVVSGTVDPVQALEAQIKATLEKAQQVAGIVSEKLKDPETAEQALSALGICKSEYNDMLDTIKEALDLVQQQNVVDAYYKFSAVISHQSSCEDAFVETPGVQIPFAEDSIAVFQLGGNCLATLDGIVNNHKL